MSDVFCACGCGGVPRVDRAGARRKFVRGHQNRGRRWAVDPNPSGVCLCGCGESVPLAGASTSGKLRSRVHVRFLPGHHSRKAAADYLVRDRGFETPCWVWQRKVTSKGYGIVEASAGRARAQHAHRFVYEREVGRLAANMELHHRCEVKLCVNPEHMRALTKREHLALHAAVA